MAISQVAHQTNSRKTLTIVVDKRSGFKLADGKSDHLSEFRTLWHVNCRSDDETRHRFLGENF